MNIINMLCVATSHVWISKSSLPL